MRNVWPLIELDLVTLVKLNENRKVSHEKFTFNGFDTFSLTFFLSLLILPVFDSLGSRKMLTDLISL